MRELFKPRGTVRSLSSARAIELELVASVERAVDSDLKRRGVIEELLAECRSRSLARPGESSWPFLYGRLLMAAGDPVEARDALEQGAVLDPRDPRITAHLALWYEAALLAATGAFSNVGLPPTAGPDVSANTSRFAATDEGLAVPEMAERSLQLFDQVMRFRLPRADVHFLVHHARVVRDSAFNADVRVHHRRLLRSV